MEIATSRISRRKLGNSWPAFFVAYLTSGISLPPLTVVMTEIYPSHLHLFHLCCQLQTFFTVHTNESIFLTAVDKLEQDFLDVYATFKNCMIIYVNTVTNYVVLVAGGRSREQTQMQTDDLLQ